MIKTLKQTLALLIMFSGLVSFSQVGINTDNSNPDPSSMLDVKSTDKGLLIPRMDSAQRVAINTPATGLLVYQTNGTDGFYFYNGTEWVNLNGNTSSAPNTMSDADNNTKIQVEKTPNDDVIRFDMAGTEFFKMDSGRLEVANTGSSVFIGAGSGASDDFTFNGNVGVGEGALNLNTSGDFNVATGFQSLSNNTTGSNNVATGLFSLLNNTTGIYNAASGAYAMGFNTTGSYNAASGTFSLSTNVKGNYNAAFGYFADVASDSLTNATAIGANAIVSQDSSLILGSGANVGIGTSAPDKSAALEVTSTNQGLLPPRLTSSQRDAISSPAPGLQIFNTTTSRPNYYNGTRWMRFDNTTIDTMVGDYIHGGVVYYLFENGDPGYVAGETHGLICTVNDISPGIQWYNGSYINTLAWDFGIGYGQSNTTAIIGAQGAGSYAATLCVAYGDGNWFLPSGLELSKMLSNQATINATALANGGTALIIGKYWSSSEYNSSQAFAADFSSGITTIFDKSNSFPIRAVRVF